MNVNELYDNIPADQQGKIVTSATAVTITQDDESAIVLLKSTNDDNAELTDREGAAVEPVHLNFSIASATSATCSPVISG